MKIAIGTKAHPKIEAVKQAAQDCVYFQGEEIETQGLKVASGVSDMPLSLDETIHGAHTRAENARKVIEDADYFVGMEGGTTIIRGIAFLFGVVYIIDKTGKGHFGISPLMQVPKEFQRRIYENNEDLGKVLGELTGVEGASQQTGSFGHWSEDMLTRKDQFTLAFTAAICPFYNKYYKL